MTYHSRPHPNIEQLTQDATKTLASCATHASDRKRICRRIYGLCTYTGYDGLDETVDVATIAMGDILTDELKALLD